MITSGLPDGVNYAFEYKMVNGKVVMTEKGDEHQSFCSIKDSENNAHSCLMYDNNSPKSVYLFCGPEHLKRNDFADGSWAVSRQERDHHKSCSCLPPREVVVYFCAGFSISPKRSLK